MLSLFSILKIKLALLLGIYFISICISLIHLKVKRFTNAFLIPLAHQLVKEHSVVDQSPADDAKETDELDWVDTPLQRLNPIGTVIWDIQRNQNANDPNQGSTTHIEQRTSESVHCLCDRNTIEVVECVWH